MLLVMDGAHAIAATNWKFLTIRGRTKCSFFVQFLSKVSPTILPEPPLLQLVASLDFARLHIRRGAFLTGLEPVLIEMLPALAGASSLALTGTSWSSASRIFVFLGSFFGRFLLPPSRGFRLGQLFLRRCCGYSLFRPCLFLGRSYLGNNLLGLGCSTPLRSSWR